MQVNAGYRGLRRRFEQQAQRGLFHQIASIIYELARQCVATGREKDGRQLAHDGLAGQHDKRLG